MITIDDIKIGMEVCFPNLVSHIRDYKGIFGVVIEILADGTLKVVWDDTLTTASCSIHDFNRPATDEDYLCFGKNKNNYVKFSDFNNLQDMIGLKVLASFTLPLVSSVLCSLCEMDNSIIGIIKRVENKILSVEWITPTRSISQTYLLDSNFPLLYYSKVVFQPDPIKHQAIDNELNNLAKFIETL